MTTMALTQWNPRLPVPSGSDGACFSGAEMGGFKRFGGGGGNKELSERKMYLSRVFQWYDFPSAP